MTTTCAKVMSACLSQPILKVNHFISMSSSFVLQKRKVPTMVDSVYNPVLCRWKLVYKGQRKNPCVFLCVISLTRLLLKPFWVYGGGCNAT